MFQNNNKNDLSEPIVVQGYSVPSKTNQSSSPGIGMGNTDQYTPAENLNVSNSEFQKGEIQPTQYKDVGFGIVFVLHLVVMLFLGSLYGGSVVNAEDGEESDNYSGVAVFVGICGVFAVTLSTLALGWMMKFAQQLVKMALFFSIGSSMALVVIGLMFGQLLLALMGLVFTGFGICYAYMVWSRIPFAAANLNTACTGVKANAGLSVVAYSFLAIAFVWSIWWSITATGTMASVGEGAIFLFFLSFYWTHQVLKNTVHVTVAGVIGTWWFDPSDASSCCSAAITDSFRRATTYSFGSICFGSFVVAVVQALRAMNEHARGQDDCQILVCLIDCILGCIQDFIEYFNKFAYVYVGLYGYSYLDAGRNVLMLFQNKGWSTIITDNLVENVIFMVSCGIGLVTGIVGVIVATFNDNIFAGVGVDEAPDMLAFILGLITGFLLSSILLGVVESAVNTVIVCFAESPNEFQSNHPELSDEMRSAWKKAWPEEFRS